MVTPATGRRSGSPRQLAPAVLALATGPVCACSRLCWLRPWTFSTIGSTNGVVVDEIDDWECKSGPWMDVFDDWEIKMDVSDDWETENVSQSFKTSMRPTQ